MMAQTYLVVALIQFTNKVPEMQWSIDGLASLQGDGA